MKNIIKWFLGFFEDQTGSASSKRGTLYIALGFLYMQVKASVNGTLPNLEINRYILYGTIVLILFCVGAITSEFFSDAIKIFNKPEVKKEEEKPKE